ncbi:solute carrier family 46 member 3 [Denticeps clupeoides]|uniref:Solute carrier family 46 member 3 n=1 Tax=Denticeps clupeoides TaxID=299321 RepID=A0AAY4EMA1_9TELE|nr:solute carrier family 46 member 3 [Denticeps clupeoides]
MKRLRCVEPVVAVYSFASFLLFPLVQQYVYRRLWMDLTNSTYPSGDDGSRCGVNGSSNRSSSHEEVQRAASLFSLHTELFSMVPSLAVTFLLVAYSDQCGRKITIVLPLVGSILYCCSFLAVSFFQLGLNWLIAASVASALFGGIGTMLGGCFSYVADLCQDGQGRTLRIAGVDMVIGLLSGVASISSGYFVRAAGFNWPLFTSALCQFLNLLYAVLVLEESRVPERSGEVTCRAAARGLLLGVRQLFVGGGHRRNVLLPVLMVTFALFSFSDIGSMSAITLYELNEPLCWNEVLIGYGSALSTIVFLTSFVGVLVLSRCASDVTIVFIGMVSVTTGLVMIAFARTTLMMFLVRIPMLLGVMPFPVLRSMMSKVVSTSEQGALFACVAFLESLSGNVALAAFSSIYAATVAWYPGFTFLLAAALCFIPIVMLSIVKLIGPVDANETEPLLPGAETGDPVDPVA